jgi:hypothetical protein
LLLKDVALMVKDAFTKWPSFARVLYCNLDYENLIVKIMLFNFLYAITHKNTIVSIFVVYIIDVLFTRLRSFIGERNIVRKTLTDDRFML